MEKIQLKRKEYSAKDRESGQVVEFGENVPIGESGKEYAKSYVSVPNKGGWYLKDKSTGEIVSKNAVIGYSDYEGMDENSRKGAAINISVCQACGSVFQNTHFLEQHAKTAHGQTPEVITEAARQAEEAQVQSQLSTSATPPVNRIKRRYTRRVPETTPTA